MRIVVTLFICLFDYFLAHFDEVWRLEDGYTQNIVFFSCTGLRLALFMTYSILLGFRVYKPEKWQMISFMIYSLIAITEFIIFVFIQI